MPLAHMGGFTNEEEVEMERATMEGEGRLWRLVWRGRMASKASWVGLDKEEEKG